MNQDREMMLSTLKTRVWAAALAVLASIATLTLAVLLPLASIEFLA
jgi:hypothetical protein